MTSGIQTELRLKSTGKYYNISKTPSVQEGHSASSISLTHCPQHVLCHYSNRQSNTRQVNKGQSRHEEEVITRTDAYQWPLEVLNVLLELLHCLILCVRALHYRRNACLPNILENGGELARGGWILGDVKLELLLPGVLCLGRVVTGLVLCSRLSSSGG